MIQCACMAGEGRPRREPASDRADDSRLRGERDHRGETDRGAQGAHLNPLGLFLRTSIPFIWRVLRAFMYPLEPPG